MRILVYPHAMEIGGSQLNAVELAGAVRDLGHDMLVVSEPGPLVDVVQTLGLEHVEIPLSRRRPDPGVIRLLLRVARERHVDVIHGHEWPPAMEAFLGPGMVSRTPVVCTVMSGGVAPFLPPSIPLVVGTEALRDVSVREGRRHVTLIEPPVDVEANHPSFDPGDFRARYRVPADAVLFVVVCRFVQELKLEGLLSACDAVSQMARDGLPVHLVTVGDGPQREVVEARISRVNSEAGRTVVTSTGQLPDPRAAYAAADIILGMGGSALRGMAFGRPLIVQGEQGFWQLCTPRTVDTFLTGGWYGLGDGPGSGVSALRSAAGPLVQDEFARQRLGAFGRELIEARFGLRAAARTQVQVYEWAMDNTSRPDPFQVATSLVPLLGYKIRRRRQRRNGVHAVDDFNSLQAMKSAAASGRSS